MLKKNNIVTGLLAAWIFPAISWIFFGYLLKDKGIFMGKPATPYLVTIALNLLIIKYLFKKGADQTGTGMILCTFVVMILVFILQRGYLL